MLFSRFTFAAFLLFIFVDCGQAFQSDGITIEDVVRIKYPGATVLSPDGSHFACVIDDQGQFDLWVVEIATGENRRVTDNRYKPSSISWSTDGKRVRFVENGDLWQARLTNLEKHKLTDTEEEESRVVWAPGDAGILFTRGEHRWFHSFKSPIQIQLDRLDRTMDRPLFSPDGKKLIYTVRPRTRRARSSTTQPESNSVRSQSTVARAGTKPATVQSGFEIMDLETGAVSYRNVKDRLRNFRWLPDSNRLLCQSGVGQKRVWSILDLREGKLTQVYKSSRRVLINPVLSPIGDKFFYVASDGEGIDTIEVVDLKDGKATQVNPGTFELGTPTWSPDGKQILFSANREQSGERHLYLAPADGSNDPVRITGHLPGTNVSAQWVGDQSERQAGTIIFQHCGPYRATDIWKMDATVNGKAKQLTHSMPEAWNDLKNVTAPELVSYKGALDHEIDAWLFKPKGFDPRKKYPAIVWIHGGPIRQMRYGWHPRRGYSIFHSFHQRLLQQGYVVLSINYRGGIGYGTKFEQALKNKMGIDDVIDVINGGKYLQSRSYVDPERVGVWGLSYGGYMTLHALGKHPGTFCMGINVAGVYNWTTQVEIYNFRGRFVNFFGGHPKDNAKAYAVGSPITYVKNINVPLLNLQGTSDKNVPFSQMDEIVNSMVEHGLDFEFLYYPGQVHVFQDANVWRHAFPRIEKFFDEHLKNAKH